MSAAQPPGQAAQSDHWRIDAHMPGARALGQKGVFKVSPVESSLCVDLGDNPLYDPRRTRRERADKPAINKVLAWRPCP